MIARFWNPEEARARFNELLKKYREAAAREATWPGRSFANNNPIKFNEAKNLIEVNFLHFNAYYQLLGDMIELWVIADQGLDDANVVRKILNIMQSLDCSAKRHVVLPGEPKSPERKMETLEKNLMLLDQWLKNHGNMTIPELEDQIGLVPGAIIRQLRRQRFGRFYRWWRENIERGGEE